MRPVISVIVPVYNTEAYIGKCLDSILAQTFTDLEVIVVNDGSTDGSGEICDAFAARDERVRVVHQENGGVSSARNVGLELAKGEYIGFVDGDDYVEADMYGMLYRLCISTKSNIAICKLGRKINGQLINGLDIEDRYIKELNNLEAMKELFIGTIYRFSLCNKIFHKSCFKNVQFPEGRIHEDLSTTYKLFANANKSVYINFIGYIYLKRDKSILTSTFNEKRMDAFIGWNEILRFMREHYNQLSKQVYACFGYWCVDNIYYILNQITDKGERMKYLKNVKQNVSKYYKYLVRNNLFPLKHKYIVSLLTYNIHLLLMSNYIKNVVL